MTPGLRCLRYAIALSIPLWIAIFIAVESIIGWGWYETAGAVLRVMAS